MKTILAVLLVFLTVNGWSQDTFVRLENGSTVKTKDGVVLRLNPGAWVPFVGKSDSGAYIIFTAAGMQGSVPWHDAALAPETQQLRLAYKGVVERMRKDYSAAIAKREAAREAAAIAAQVRAEQQAIANEEYQRARFLWELQEIREQLERLNRRR